MATVSPITLPSSHAPQIGAPLDDCALWMGQARAIVSVLLGALDQPGGLDPIGRDQLDALYAANTLMTWAESALAIGHAAATSQRAAA